jgi:hypothetical protein
MHQPGVEKVSDHGTIGPRKFFEFPENISPRKKNINRKNATCTAGMTSEMQVHLNSTKLVG